MGTSSGSEVPGVEAVGIVVVRHRLAMAVDHPDGIGAGVAGGVGPARGWSREVLVQRVAVAEMVIHRSA